MPEPVPVTLRSVGGQRGRSTSTVGHEAAAVGRTIERHGMLDGVRRLGVAISGGADSLTMLDQLHRYVRGAERPTVELVPFHVKQYEHVDERRIVDWVQHYYEGAYRLDIVVAPADKAAARLLDGGRAPCRACSAIRASAIARTARSLDLDAVALGHHLTDAMATLWMNMLHESKVDTMRPVTVRRRGGRVRIVRPLFDLPEDEVKKLSPAGPAGLTDCGMCSVSADERAAATAFVNQAVKRHRGADQRLVALLDSLTRRPTP